MILIKSLKNFFGIGLTAHGYRHVSPRKPVGNRALPKDMQLEIMEAAQAKRNRKNRR